MSTILIELDSLSEILKNSIREALYPEQRYLTVMEAAAYMGIKRRKIYQLMENGWLPWGTWDDGNRYIDKQDIDNLFSKNKNDPRGLLKHFKS